MLVGGYSPCLGVHVAKLFPQNRKLCHFHDNPTYVLDYFFLEWECDLHFNLISFYYFPSVLRIILDQVDSFRLHY